MKLRYHQKVFETDKDYKGLLVLESEPQMRNLYFNKPSTRNGYELKLERVPLPYIYFLIKYDCEYNQCFYPGLYGAGLRVYGSLVPINSFKERVFLLPTDQERLGLVCTNHLYDGKLFDNYYELANFVMGLWWNSTHNLRDPFLPSHWKNKKLEDLNKCKWRYIHDNLFETMMYKTGLHEERPLRDKKFRNYQWPPKKFTRKKNEIKI